MEFLSPTTSYFEVLRVPTAATEELLTKRFRELSRLYHPDRFATADAATQTAALDSSALLNDAYRTLRDLFTRAEYLLRRERGIRPDDLKKIASPPKELFAEVLELQEMIVEFQEARMDDDNATVARLTPELQAARTRFQSAYDALKDRLQTLFAQWDSDADREAVLNGVAEVVGTRGYLRRVLNNLTAAVGTTGS
jgi:molecular chaperone HscB